MRSARRALRGAAVVLAAAALPAVGLAQVGAGSPLGCRGERVAIITILTVRPAELALLGDEGLGAALVRRVWTPTQPQVVRDFLRVREGAPCVELARRESERILRAQPFIADARIRVIPLGGDSIGLAVETEDEVPIDAGLRLQRGSIGRVRVGTQNFDGTGIALAMDWRNGFAYRDGIGVQLRNPQLAGRPWVSELSARRDPLGGGWAASLRWPFLTDLQRGTWYAGTQRDNVFVPFRVGAAVPVMVDTDRLQWLLAAGRRFGTPRRSILGGLLLEGEDVRNAASPIIAADSGPVPFVGSTLAEAFPDFTAVRGGWALGLRYLDFVPARGFDALTGRQDLPRGVQASLRVTRSLWAEGGVERDLLLGSSLYAGTSGARHYVALQVDAEGRRPRGAPWDGIVGSGRAAWYFQPTPGRLRSLSAEFGGGWQPRAPFQLSAGDRTGGLRGYDEIRTGGGQRVVLRAEERWRVPVPGRRADAAVAVFSDAGRVWAGDSPFGRTTPVLASAGLSLLLAAPVGSSRTLRLDLGLPLVDQPGLRQAELRLTYRDATRAFWLEPLELSRGRQGALRGAVFID